MYKNYGGWGQQAQLPLGWEAKWDPGSDRWFYIDHTTRTTHWELPKTPAPKQPEVQPRPAFVSSLSSKFPSAPVEIIKEILVNTSNNLMESKTNLQSMGYREKVETVADPKLVKQLISEHISVSQTFAESLLKKHNNDLDAARKALGDKGYRKKAQPVARHVKTLMHEYPDAEETVVKEVLVSNSNSIANARGTLEAIGYKKAKPKPVTMPKSISPPKLTASTKKDRLEQIKKKFPKVAERIIEMSLEGTNYDITLATAVLKASLESVDAKASTSSRTTTDHPTTSSPSKTGLKSSSLEPVIFGDNQNDYRPKIPAISNKGISKTTASAASTSRPAARSKAPIMKKVITKKALLPGYVSQNLCTPSGPNADLVKGPNEALLQESLIKPSRPDPMNRCGPQWSNRYGPDPHNFQGPAGLAVGAMSAALIETFV